MLNANELCKEKELHNYRQSHFLMDDSVFIISLSDLYDLFNLDTLDVYLMRCFTL
jgi:hypothetical protein